MKKVLMLSAMLLILFSSCERHHEEETSEMFLATSPIRMDTTTSRDYVCQIRAIQHIELRALESGYLEQIFVDEGQFVKKGTLMFQILPIQYKAELQKAQAEANYVEIEYEQAKILADSNVISKTQLALAKAKYEKAIAELELAKVHMSFTEIRAPFDGLMDRFQVRLGSLLDDGELLTTMSDISTLWVYFNVPEAEYLGYKKESLHNNGKLKVDLKMANGEMYDHEGLVETIEADFNNETGNIAFRATFPNPDRLLRHGETGNVVMTIGHKNAMLIPQKTTFEVLDQKYVYVIDSENHLKSKQIHVLAEMPDIYIIDGLETTDKILLEGLRKVRENDEVEFEFKDPKTVISDLRLHAE